MSFKGNRQGGRWRPKLKNLERGVEETWLPFADLRRAENRTDDRRRKLIDSLPVAKYAEELTVLSLLKDEVHYESHWHSPWRSSSEGPTSLFASDPFPPSDDLNTLRLLRWRALSRHSGIISLERRQQQPKILGDVIAHLRSGAYPRHRISGRPSASFCTREPPSMRPTKHHGGKFEPYRYGASNGDNGNWLRGVVVFGVAQVQYDYGLGNSVEAFELSCTARFMMVVTQHSHPLETYDAMEESLSRYSPFCRVVVPDGWLLNSGDASCKAGNEIIFILARTPWIGVQGSRASGMLPRRQIPGSLSSFLPFTLFTLQSFLRYMMDSGKLPNYKSSYLFRFHPYARVKPSARERVMNPSTVIAPNLDDVVNLTGSVDAPRRKLSMSTLVVVNMNVTIIRETGSRLIGD
ncbi:hypothetical protein M404DRAFT_7200 [Pisolithus tinctorius Marx 270]|uniref:Uncharacterized protein n=1 Tax=Pisolithus tinctorius Marx 270 TaxID=870435 RepID=A0A0C3PTA8_PISTI|nr:hypothetical protein M404DRAFT_7200 [Pisolithus tinctorius Marx 270]